MSNLQINLHICLIFCTFAASFVYPELTRNHEGDYLCRKDCVFAMVREAFTNMIITGA